MKILLVHNADRTVMALAPALAKHGYSVDLLYWERENLSNYSTYIRKFIKIRSENYNISVMTSALEEVLILERYDAIVPTNDIAAFILSSLLEKFPEYDNKLVLARSKLQFLNDKWLGHKLFNQHIGCLDTILIQKGNSEDTIVSEKIANRIGFPMVVKPRQPVIQRSFNLLKTSSKIVSDYPSLCAYLKEWSPHVDAILQTYLDGYGYGINVVCWQGNIKHISKNVRLHEPGSGGSSSFRRSSEVDVEDVQEIANFVKKNGISGVLMFEFRETKLGSVFMEINPRFWGSIGLTLEANQLFIERFLEIISQSPRMSDVVNDDFKTVYKINLTRDIRWYLRNIKSKNIRVVGANLQLLVRQLVKGQLSIDEKILFGAAGIKYISDRLIKKVKKIHCYHLNGKQRRVLGALQPKINYLFVCNGNINRSAFCEDLLVNKGISAQSCGIYNKLPRERSIYLKNFYHGTSNEKRSQIFNAELAAESDVIVIFDMKQYQFIKMHYQNEVLQKIKFFAQQDVVDPEGRSPDDYTLCFQKIEDTINNLLLKAPK